MRVHLESQIALMAEDGHFMEFQKYQIKFQRGKRFNVVVRMYIDG